MKKDPKTYDEALRDFQEEIHEFRDAVLGAVPLKWISKFFRWLEYHDAWLWLVIGLALLPLFLALLVFILKPVK